MARTHVYWPSTVGRIPKIDPLDVGVGLAVLAGIGFLGWTIYDANFGLPSLPAGRAPALSEHELARCRRTPAVYANEKIGTLQRWWAGDVGEWIRRIGASMWPGTPPEALMGFASNASPTDDTPGESFHAWGLFGVPSTRWNSLRTDRRVIAALGRNAGTDWRVLPDQIAVGMANLLDDGYATQAALPSSIRATAIDSPWFVAASFSGWSTGTGPTARRFSQFEPQLARSFQGDRWTSYLKALVDAYGSGALRSHDACTHGNAAFSAIRTAQKLAAGRALAERTGGRVSWFDVGPERVLEYLTIVGSQNA